MKFLSSLIRNLSILLAIAGFIAIVYIYRVQTSKQMPPIVDPPYPPATKTTRTSISATGILEALSENVAIGVPQAGLVAEVFVQVGDAVQINTPLFRLDDTDLQAQLLTATAKKQVITANLTVAKAQLSRAQAQLNRINSITDPRAISAENQETLQQNTTIAEAQLVAAEAECLAMEAEIQSLHLRIQHLLVRAPRNGSIIQLNIRPGEFAASSPKTPAIILGDLRKLQVRADVDEQNAPHIATNCRAFASLKGDPSTKLPLHFVRIEPFIIPKISLTGASTERVDTRVLQVIFSLERPNTPPIYVGQQVDVFIDPPEK